MGCSRHTFAQKLINTTIMTQIEIFKTNVSNERDASIIANQLKKSAPGYNINFDIEDCDRIMRIESINQKVNIESIIELLNKNNFTCEVLN
jgi:hypothetical protein